MKFHEEIIVRNIINYNNSTFNSMGDYFFNIRSGKDIKIR